MKPMKASIKNVVLMSKMKMKTKVTQEDTNSIEDIPMGPLPRPMRASLIIVIIAAITGAEADVPNTREKSIGVMGQ